MPLLWLIAAKEANRKVTPPTNMASRPASLSPSTGLNLIIKKTPALTMVEEWSRAEVGVGATMAPKSQDENGICAVLFGSKALFDDALDAVLGNFLIGDALRLVGDAIGATMAVNPASDCRA